MVRLPADISQMNSQHSEAVEIIARGGIIGFRTDTFYGLGADPFNAAAVRRVRELKGREESNPILLLICDLTETERFIAHQSETFRRVADRFWPGPLTVVGVARPELPSELTAGTGTIGVRLPNNETVRSLVRVCGGALTATSANVSGQPPARTAADVRNYFPKGLDLVVDGGEVSAAQASTVLDLSGERARLVREGALTREALGSLVSF